MKIVEDSSLKIFPTKQTIDQSLGLPLPFHDRNQVIVCCGGQGTGKSTWLNSALTCRKKNGKIFAGCYERVFYATPEECFYGSEKEHPMAKHIKSRLFHEFNVDMLTRVAEQALENKHENEGNSILIIDDFSEELKNIETIKLLKKLINKHRHLNLTILLSSTATKNIPKCIRQLVDVFVIFKPKSLIEIDDYVTEIFAMKPNEMQRLLDFVFDAPHNFLMYFNRTNQFYKNFERITL